VKFFGGGTMCSGSTVVEGCPQRIQCGNPNVSSQTVAEIKLCISPTRCVGQAIRGKHVFRRESSDHKRLRSQLWTAMPSLPPRWLTSRRDGSPAPTAEGRRLLTLCCLMYVMDNHGTFWHTGRS